jgi:hypothetical protein
MNHIQPSLKAKNAEMYQKWSGSAAESDVSFVMASGRGNDSYFPFCWAGLLSLLTLLSLIAAALREILASNQARSLLIGDFPFKTGWRLAKGVGSSTWNSCGGPIRDPEQLSSRNCSGVSVP